MKKRLKKKVGSRYNLLTRAKRQKQKRRGNRIIDYAFVPIGINDKQAAEEEGFSQDYPYATHWYVKVKYSRDAVFKNKRVHYILTVQPCKENGGTDRETALQFFLYTTQSKETINDIFIKLVNDLKNDNFWDNEDYVF